MDPRMPPHMRGVPQQLEPQEPTTLDKAMYYTFVSLNYGFTALKWGWLPFIVVLGATSAYCGPSFNIKRDILGIGEAPPARY